MLVEVTPGQRDRLRNTGVVYVVEVDLDGVDLPRFVGYWESELSDHSVLVEEGSWETETEAVKWGLTRGAVVLVAHSDGRNTLYDRS